MLSLLLAFWTFVPHSFNTYLSLGASPFNKHGRSVFRSIHFEGVATVPNGPRVLHQSEVGAALTYHAIYQAQSWFGYRDGNGNDDVRAESLYVFLRRDHARVFWDIGTGPMWSNRRVPAATSRLNFQSQLTAGAKFGRVRIAYRFGHVSNGGLANRNPGLAVSTLLVGFQVRKFGDGARAPSP